VQDTSKNLQSAAETNEFDCFRLLLGKVVVTIPRGKLDAEPRAEVTATPALAR
jgi:hypothetical protein